MADLPSRETTGKECPSSKEMNYYHELLLSRVRGNDKHTINALRHGIIVGVRVVPGSEVFPR